MSLYRYIPIESFEIRFRDIRITDIFPNKINVDIERLSVEYFFEVQTSSAMYGCLDSGNVTYDSGGINFRGKSK